MAHYNAEAEPFEESQGNRSAKASPDELKAFYHEMQKTDLERKLSKRKSSSGSIWSRKSKRTSTSQTQSPQSPAPAPSRKPPSLNPPSTTSIARVPSSSREHGGDRIDTVPPMPVSRSIIPEPLNELPAWYRDSAYFTTRYPMHNPVGPKWYKNHHLVPPSTSRPGGRPPSVFSSSFPPMAPGDRSETNLRRSPSKSPLPTPNSSQTRMEDVSNLPRSRKTSQTAHDNVDLMDVSDPWGTPWHHESPYDVGKSNSPVSAEENPSGSRSRSSSVTALQNRRKTVTPSPLSQSTSAVHLQIPEASGQPLPRKLSKRRTVGLFGRQTTSAPASPVETLKTQRASPVQPGPPSSFVSGDTIKKERRSSVLGRIAKRFSLARKPPPVVAMEVVRQPSPQTRQPSPDKAQSPDVTRYTPPLVPQESAFVVVSLQSETSTPKVEDDRSSVSLDADVTYRMGRLTVANPDPGSVENTPVQREMSLPPEEWERGHERDATDKTLTPNPGSPTPYIQSPVLPVRDSRSPQQVSPVTKLAPSPQNQPDTVGYKRQTESPPPPPEKPSGNDHLFQRPSSGTRSSVEHSSSPLSNGASSTSRKAPTTNRVVEKPQPPPPSSPSPELPVVPFPVDYGSSPPSRDLAPPSPMMTADISPLSTSSMLVNPPTPYNPDTPMLDEDEPEPVPPPVPSKRSSRDPSPGQVAVTGRETETFKLIRSASGTVYASTETIRAAGEQWEVVESAKSRVKSKSQDRDGESRREQRRQARVEKEADTEQKGRGERRHPSAEMPTSNSQTLPRSASEQQHRSIPDMFPGQEDPRANQRTRDNERESRRERKVADFKFEKPQPALPAPSRTLERNPSNAARPISEIPTAADMNQLRAREAWDLDRLWKARSLSGMEPNGLVAAPMPAAGPVNGKHAEDQHAIYGSSHTAFMMSTPFQQKPAAQIYHSMPPGPPPIVYPAKYAVPNDHSSTNRSSPSDHSSNSMSPPHLVVGNNPLPEPPRESPYQPAPLTLPEYWNKHTSVAT